MKDNLVKFSDLSLGVKFQYPGKEKIFVKIDYNRVAEWDDKNIDTKWIGQGIYSAVENEADLSDLYVSIYEKTESTTVPDLTRLFELAEAHDCGDTDWKAVRKEIYSLK